MPYIVLPDGSGFEIKPGETPEQALAAAQRKYPQLFADETKAKSGFTANLKAGAQEYGGNFLSGIAGQADPELVRQMSRANQARDIETAKTVGWDETKEALGAQGIGGIGTLGAFMRDSIARSLPQMGATLAGAKAGAMLGGMAGPVGAGVGGAAGALAANIPAFVGSNLGRQVLEQDATGKEAPLDVPAANAAGAVQGSLDAASTMFMLGKLGFKGAGSLLKKPAAEAEAALAKKAAESLKMAMAKGAAKGAAVEIPTEVAQQILERAQAGLPLMDEAARKEYEAAAAGAVVVGGPLGTFGGASDRGRARDEKKKIDAIKAREAIAAEKQAKIDAENAADTRDPMQRFAEDVLGVETPPEPEPKDEDYIPGVTGSIKPPIPQAQQDLLKALTGVRHAASLYGQEPTPEDILGVLEKRPDLAYQVLKGEAIIPGIDQDARKKIHAELRNQAGLAERTGKLIDSTERSTEERLNKREMLKEQELQDEIAEGRTLLEKDKADLENPNPPIEPATKTDINAYRKGELQPPVQEPAQEEIPVAVSPPDPLESILDKTLPEQKSRSEIEVEEQDLTNARRKMLAQLNEYIDDLVVLREPMSEGKKREHLMQSDKIARDLGQNVLDQINASRELNGYAPMEWQGAADLAKYVATEIRRRAFSPRGNKEPGSASRVEAHQVKEAIDRLEARKQAMQTNVVEGRNRVFQSRNIERIERMQQALRSRALESQKEEDLYGFLQKVIDDGVFAGERLRDTRSGAVQADKTPFRLREDNSMFDARRAKDAPKDEYEEMARRIREAPIEGNKQRLREQLKSAQMKGRGRPMTMTEAARAAQEQIAGEEAQPELPFGPAKGPGGKFESRKLSTDLSKRPPAKPVPPPEKVEDTAKKKLEDAKYDLEAVKERKASVLQFHSDVIAAQADEKAAWRNVEARRQKLQDLSEGRGQAYNEAKNKLEEELDKMALLSRQEEEIRSRLIKLTDPEKRDGLVKTAERINAKADIQEIVVRRARVAVKESVGRTWAFEMNRAMGELRKAELDFESAFKRQNELGSKLAEIRKTVPDNEAELQARFERMRDIFERRDVGDARRLLEQAEKERKSAEKLIAEQKKLEANADNIKPFDQPKRTDPSPGVLKPELERKPDPEEKYTGDEYEFEQKREEEILHAAGSKVRRKAAREGMQPEAYLKGLSRDQFNALMDAAKKKVQDFLDKAAAKGRTPAKDRSNWGKATARLNKEVLEEMIRKGEVPTMDEQSMESIARVMNRQARVTDVAPHHKFNPNLKTGNKEARTAEDQVAKNRKILAERFARQRQREKERLGDIDYAPGTVPVIDVQEAIAEGRERKKAESYQGLNFHKKTFSEAAAYLEGELVEPYLKEISRRLKDVFDAAHFKGEVLINPNIKGGFYSNSEGVIVMEASIPYVALHELTHAATVYGIHNNAKLKADIRALMDRVKAFARTKEGHEAIERFKLKEPGQGPFGVYALSNELEFIAEAMSHPGFQGFLNQIPTTQPKKTLWNSLVEAIARFLKLSPKSWTAFHDALTLAERSLKETKAILDRGLVPEGAPEFGEYYRKPTFDGEFVEYAALHDKLEGKEKSFKEKYMPSLLGLRTTFLDRLGPLQEIADTHKDKLDDAVKSTNMMYASRMYDQKNSLVAETAIEGPMKLSKDKGGRILIEAQENGPSLKKLGEFMSKQTEGGDPATRDALYSMYRKAKRAQRVGWNTLNEKLTPEERALGDKLVSNPLSWFKEADEIYNAYNKGLIDFAVQAGALSKEVAAEMSKHGDYVPYYRQDKDQVMLELDSGVTVSVGNMKYQPYLRELVGGTRETLPFWAAALQNTTMLTDLAMRNLATRNTTIALYEFDMGRFVAPTAEGSNILRFRIDGEDKAFRVDSDAAGIPSEMLVKGMEGVASAMPAALKMMGIPAKLLRRMVTRSPIYMAKQVFRDSLWAGIASGADIMPVASSIKEIAKGITGNADNSLRRRGVVGGNVFSHDFSDNERILKEFSSGKTGWATAMAKLDSMSLEADAATRRAAYDSYIKQGLSEQEATLAALESMNFSRHGTSSSLRMLGVMIPFMNAQLQGLDALYRAFKGKAPLEEKLNIRKKLVTRGLMLTGMTLLYASMMQDDEAYKNASPEDRLNNWFVRVPGLDEPVKIPMPFELGFIFKAVPEALFGMMAGDLEGEEAARGLRELAWMSVPNVLMPQGMKPAIEVALNTSMMNWSDIETDADRRVDKTQRYNDRTSEIAKALSFSTDVAGREIGLSPKQIEYLVRGYTAGLGTALFKAMDIFLPVGVEKPEKLASELPLVGTSLQPVDTLGRVNALYKELQKIDQSKGTLDKLVAEGKFDEADAYMDENIDNISKAKMARKIRENLSKFKSMEHAIRVDPALSAAEKRKELDALRKDQLDFMKDARDILRQQ
jgi:hypothetical protein